MQKRPCGKTGHDLTVINFGAMRMYGDEVKPWAEFVAEAADAGFNYFETSHRYCDKTSEIKLGEGLKGRRDKVYISTKSSAADQPTSDAVRRMIDESLAKLQVDYLDFYQTWGLSLESWEQIASKPGGTLEGIRKAMSEGLIRHLGFTSHDNADNVIALLRTGEFESATLQYNIINRAMEPAIEEAGRLGIGIVVMSPLHGGILGTRSPLFDRLMGPGATEAAAETAFRFILSNPNVTTAISGMRTRADIDANRRIAETVRPLSRAEVAALDRELKRFEAASDSLCTGCWYCMPCPMGVTIPDVFELANHARVYGLVEGALRGYGLFGKGWPYAEAKDATHCVECGQCLAKCPQKINIPVELKKAHGVLSR